MKEQQAQQEDPIERFEVKIHGMLNISLIFIYVNYFIDYKLFYY